MQLHDFQGAVLRLDAELEKIAKEKAHVEPKAIVIEVRLCASQRCTQSRP